MRSTLLLSAFAFILVGCGDHNGGGGDMGVPDMTVVIEDMSIPNDAQTAVTYSMFAQDLAQALCAHAMACGELDAAQMSACIERNLRHTGWDQDLEIMKGRMEINELQCIMAVQNSRCDESDSASWVTRCLQFLYKPHVANGSACVANAECSTGYCQHAGSDAGMIEQVAGCPGSCAPFKSIGAPCRLNSDCASDGTVYCDVNNTKTCQPLAAVNQACSNIAGVGTGPSCQFGYLCPTFAASPTCQVPTMQTTVGGDCDPFQGSATPTPPCATGMYCQLQYATSATACTGTTPFECGLLGYCDTGTHTCMNANGGKCQNKLAKNAACDPNNEGFFSFADNQCVDGNICFKAGAQTSTTCQPFGGANADCAGDTTCKVGFSCTAGKCTAWASDSQMCAASGQCAGGAPGQPVCIADNADAGANTTCQQMKSVGAACNPGFEDSLCTNADLPGTSYCAPNATSGTCAPKCF